MMPSTELAQLPYPAGSQTPAVAADLMALANALDNQVFTVVADAGERDAQLYNAKPGKVAVTRDGSMWVKISEPGTAPVWLPVTTQELYTGFAWNTDPEFQDNNNRSFIARDGSRYYLFIETVYLGPDLVGGAGGFLPDTRICTITDLAWRPKSSTATFSFTAAPNFAAHGVCYGSTGTVNLTHSSNGATLSSGTSGVLSTSWLSI
jgi:hypothetical protein